MRHLNETSTDKNHAVIRSTPPEPVQLETEPLCHPGLRSLSSRSRHSRQNSIKSVCYPSLRCWKPGYPNLCLLGLHCLSLSRLRRDSSNLHPAIHAMPPGYAQLEAGTLKPGRLSLHSSKDYYLKLRHHPIRWDGPSYHHRQCRLSKCTDLRHMGLRRRHHSRIEVARQHHLSACVRTNTTQVRAVLPV